MQTLKLFVVTLVGSIPLGLIICFNKLTEENFRSIAALMLGEVRDLMREKGMELSWDCLLYTSSPRRRWTSGCARPRALSA